ncbi:MAG: HesA/MoeB/ThiF family protein [Reyranella sp.]
MVADEHLDLRRTLVANGFDRDRQYRRGFRYTGTLSINRQPIDVALTFEDLEFTRPPILTLRNPKRDCPDVVAHLGHDHEFCYARKEQVVLDRYNVGGSVLACLDMAKKSLERALTHKDFSKEVALELPQHWLGDIVALVDYRGSQSGSAGLYRVPRSTNTQVTFLTDVRESLRVFDLSSSVFAATAKSHTPAYVYRTNRALTFASGVRQPKTLAEFLTWAESIEIGLADKLIAAAVEKYPKVSALFLFAPNGCVGIDLKLSIAPEKFQSGRALAIHLKQHASTLPIKRIECGRMDPDFVFSRNENRAPPLAAKRIVVIGCGTIGSHLAKLLAQSGAGWNGGSLTLIDREALAPGNVGRHFLGLQHVAENKAEAVKEELLRLFPESAISARRDDAIRLLPVLSGADLIIDATGEEALSRSINDYFVSQRRSRRAPAVIHVWLIGYGDAAQTLLVESTDSACYKCLRVGHDGKWRFSPLLPDRKPELVFGPCGDGMFMAYSVAAPVIAAGLGLQMAIDWAVGDAKPYFRTICIDTRTTHPVRNQNVSRLEGCPACGAAASHDDAQGTGTHSGL